MDQRTYTNRKGVLFMKNRNRQPYVEPDYFERAYSQLAALFVQCDAYDYHNWDVDFIRINNLLSTELFPELEASRTGKEPATIAMSAKYHGRQYFTLGGEDASPEFYDQASRLAGFMSPESLMQHDFKPWQVKQSIQLIEDFCHYGHCQGLADITRKLRNASIPGAEKKRTGHILEILLAARAAENPSEKYPSAEGFLQELSGRTPAAGYTLLVKSPDIQDALIPLIGQGGTFAQLFYVFPDAGLDSREFLNDYKQYVAEHLAECWARPLARYDLGFQDIEIKDISGILTDTENLVGESYPVYVKNPMTGECQLAPAVLEILVRGDEAGRFRNFYSVNDADRLLSSDKNAFFVSADTVEGDTVARNTMRLTGDDFHKYSLARLLENGDFAQTRQAPSGQPPAELAAEETTDMDREP
jgi:hypothetical protein